MACTAANCPTLGGFDHAPWREHGKDCNTHLGEE
jgi:hypothetical protein